MKFSIIITEKNCKNLLIKCLDSVSNQTYKKYEVIIVDDGSDSRADYIVDKYNNFKYIYLESSKGPGGARNVGLKIATGDYICFLDSDDWWELSYLESAYNVLSKCEADIGMMGLVRNYDTPSSTPIYKCRYDNECILDGEIAFKIMTYQYDMGIKVIPAATNKFYKKQFLDQHNLSFIDDIFFEDLPFNFKAMRFAKKVACIPNSFYHHYRRMGSIIQSFNLKNLNDLVFVFETIRNNLKNEKLYEKYMFNYYKFLDHFYNLIVRQIFQFVSDENEKKHLLQLSLQKFKHLIIIDEYLQFITSEELRRHIQPHINDTTLY